MSKEKTITVYACGGGGVNIGHLIEENVRGINGKGDHTVFAKVVVTYIDTSEANTKFRNIDSNVYLYKGIDGSGSDRTKNKDSITDSIRDILLKHPPGDLSVVINTTGGGSGSVIGPMIVSHLLSENKLVIAMAVQSTSTMTQLRNTINVLSTYETISLRRKKVLPLVLCNNADESENNVNTTITNAVEMLAVLFSGGIERLDSTDLDHWINYDKVTRNQPGAVLLDLAYNSDVFPDDHVVCSVATLANGTETKTDFSRPVEYQAVGFIDPMVKDATDKKCVHFVLIDGPIQLAHETRVKEYETIERMTLSRKTRKSIAVDTDSDDGMVF